jgi:acyl transferase domain-containing protein
MYFLLQDGSSVLRPRFGGWLNNVESFDASLFSIKNTEAQCMDPQHRILLEASWDAYGGHVAGWLT